MARANLTAQSAATAGLKATYTAAVADGHMFAPKRGRVLHVKNGGGSSLTVTVQAEFTRAGLALPDRTVTLLTTEEKFIGPFDEVTFAQKSGADEGKVYVDYSATASVTVALIDVG